MGIRFGALFVGGHSGTIPQGRYRVCNNALTKGLTAETGRAATATVAFDTPLVLLRINSAELYDRARALYTSD